MILKLEKLLRLQNQWSLTPLIFVTHSTAYSYNFGTLSWANYGLTDSGNTRWTQPMSPSPAAKPDSKK